MKLFKFFKRAAQPAPLTYAPQQRPAASIPQDVSFDKPLDKAKLVPGEPCFSVGFVPDPENFSSYDGKLRVESVRIKKPGELTHSIPASCRHLMGAIKAIIDFEFANSDLALGKTALLTVRQYEVAPGKQQNTIGWHRDRVGRTYDDEPDYPLADHIYIVSDTDVALIQARSLKDAFGELESGKAKEGSDYIQARPNEIVLMTNYCTHKPGVKEARGVRTFIQLIYTSPSYEYCGIQRGPSPQ
ncbi:MAG: hypothetical protein H6867_08740 [Rhodospirillales bacterium]|nr:hypothetical protein [Rhodospirillales bacterium]MCB9995641.1 hypothetical protein [Rhodospirillales bacterium]